MSKNSRPSPARTGVILRFTRKRGRPKQDQQRGHDHGTPELLRKRALGETTEMLDLCLSRGLISREQHWCGIHLRWLYTLRYGAPGVRALDPLHFGGKDTTPDDPQWRGQREREYHEAIALLAHTGHALLVMNICVHNERPLFLRTASRPLRVSKAALDSFMLLREGLDILTCHWCEGKEDSEVGAQGAGIDR